MPNAIETSTPKGHTLQIRLCSEGLALENVVRNMTLQGTLDHMQY